MSGQPQEASTTEVSANLAGRLRFAVIGLVFTINLGGGLLLYLYYTVIDVSSLQKMRFIKDAETLAISLLPAVLGTALCWFYSRPVVEYLQTVSRPGLEPLDEESGGGWIIQLRRKALRFPLVCALSALFAWAGMGLVLAVRVWLNTRGAGVPLAETPVESLGVGELLSEQLLVSGMDLNRLWTAFVQSIKALGLATMLGCMLSAMVFFVVESVWRRELPKFFPGGRISAVKDTWIIPVRYRLVAIFVLVGTLPLVLMAILSYQRAYSMISQDPEDVLGGLLLINLFIVLVGAAMAALLSVYAAKSVSDPLEGLRSAMEEVKVGKLDVRVPVRANDEIGRVTEGFNDMIRTLAVKEASILELTHGLEQKVEERTAELREALEEKKRTQAQLIQSEKMAGLGQMVAGVAHEINNPLGYIYANTDHFERYLEKIEGAFEKGDAEEFEKASEKLQRLVKSTREGAQRTREIVQGLRTFSRRDAKASRPFDLHEAIETSLMLLSHEIKRGVDVIKDYGEVPLVSGNQGELSQVFMNVMVNAIQAMDGEGTLTIETGRTNSHAYVRISDTGPGIPDHAMAHLFEPFFTTKEVGSGSGLGLSIAYGIVKSYGGDIKVESEEGVGTVMTIEMPVDEDTEENLS